MKEASTNAGGTSETLDLAALAAEAVASTETSEAARAWLAAKAAADPQLAAAMIPVAAATLVCNVFSDSRRSVMANADRGVSDDGLEALNRASHRGLMAWPLPGSRIPIGDATREQVAESLRFCRTLSITYDLNARFLGNVHRLATDEKKPIKRQLTPEQVRSCRERAEKAAA